MRTPGKTYDPQADALRAVTRDVRRAHRIRTGKATTVLIDVDVLREVLREADERTARVLEEHLGEHTVGAVFDAEVSA